MTNQYLFLEPPNTRPSGMVPAARIEGESILPAVKALRAIVESQGLDPSAVNGWIVYKCKPVSENKGAVLIYMGTVVKGGVSWLK